MIDSWAGRDLVRNNEFDLEAARRDAVAAAGIMHTSNTEPVVPEAPHVPDSARPVVQPAVPDQSSPVELEAGQLTPAQLAAEQPTTEQSPAMAPAAMEKPPQGEEAGPEQGVEAMVKLLHQEQAFSFGAALARALLRRAAAVALGENTVNADRKR